jgi:uncharacterized membrane protein
MSATISSESCTPAASQQNGSENPPSQKSRIPAKGHSVWWLVAALLVLSAIPVAAGAFRLNQLAGNPEITPANARFVTAPLPVVLHIIAAGVYAVLGAFQFVPGLRKRRNNWHRIAGWIVIPSGLIVALSGLWMTLFYSWPAGDGVLLYGLRLLFGSAMLIAILLGIAAIRRRDFARHGDWMARGYAIGLGAGTQVFTLAVGEAIAGPPDELRRALLMGAAWVINLAVAEWAIRRRATRVRTVAQQAQSTDL